MINIGYMELIKAGLRAAAGAVVRAVGRGSETIEDDKSLLISRELAKQQRRASEYFEVIQSMERQRDEWREMFHIQAREHLAAQIMLERELVAVRKTCCRAIVELNKLRKSKGLEEITRPENLAPYDGEPVGEEESYGSRMRQLHDQMPEDHRAEQLVDDVHQRLETLEASG